MRTFAFGIEGKYDDPKACLSTYQSIDEINRKQLCTADPWLLQEDNDNSHGTRSDTSVAAELKNNNWIAMLVHPAKSRSQPAEGVWNILRNRLRKEKWRTLEEYKEILQRLWRDIKQSGGPGTY